MLVKQVNNALKLCVGVLRNKLKELNPVCDRLRLVIYYTSKERYDEHGYIK